MPTWAIIVMIAVFVLTDAVVVTAVLKATIGGVFNKLHADHPPTEPAPDAVRKDLQSFKSGLINLGWSVNVTVDDRCLHLEPAAVFRMLGAKSSSIPWDAIEPKGKPGKRCRSVRIGSVDLMGPAWCLRLAGEA